MPVQAYHHWQRNFDVVFRERYLFLSLLIIPGYCLFVGKRLRAKSGNEILAEDTRSPIIYFRSFTDDDKILIKSGRKWRYIWDRDTDEEKLERLLRPIGPLIAIGNPEDLLSLPGAARIYTSGSWKEVVTSLIGRARSVILRTGETPSLWWELATVIRLCDPQNVVLFHPKIIQGERAKERKQIRSYKHFREKANILYPAPLPEQLGTAL